MSNQCVRILPKLGFIDSPTTHRIHLSIIPRGGGIAIIFAFMSALFISLDGVASYHGLSHLLLAMFILLVTGLIDDRFGMRGMLKLSFQCSALMVLWLGGTRLEVLFGVHLAPFISFLATMIGGIVIINGFNLIDGLDGLATGIALLISGIVAGVGYFTGEVFIFVTSMLMFGSCLGFLFYNWHPAKIFMGDTGSMCIGLYLVYIFFSISRKFDTFPVTFGLILLLWIPCLDILLAVCRRGMRMMRRVKNAGFMVRDQEHLHHRLLNKTQSQVRTLLILLIAECLCACAGVLLILFPSIYLTITIMLIVIAISIVYGTEIERQEIIYLIRKYKK